MLLNLSSDIPFIFKDSKFKFFERKKLESELPLFFKEEKAREIYLINWPWNFSTTRIWVELINILFFLWKLDKAYCMNKIDLFLQSWYEYIYLFSWNKNKILELKGKSDIDFISPKDLKRKKSEEIFSKDGNLTEDIIRYADLLSDYEKLARPEYNIDNLLRPFYSFDPIVNC